MDDALILTELRAIRTDMQTAHGELVKKVEDGFQKITAAAGAHELTDVMRFNEVSTRLVPLETLRKNGRWLLTTALGAAILALFDLLVNHFPKLL